jgi:hypothetical protein
LRLSIVGELMGLPMHWGKRTLLGLALLGLPLTTTSCQRASQPRTIVVQKGDITRLEDGGYRVTAGWMHHRMQVEAALKTALDRCQTRLERFQ